MRCAYADPPYVGQAKRWYGREAREVNLPLLFAHLEEFDGWALSGHGHGLRAVLSVCPEDVRVAVWVNTSAAPHAGERIIPAWEPVFYRSGRRLRSRLGEPAITNALIHPGATAKAYRFKGAKPEAFTFWVLGLLGVEEGDTVDDLFPGSGAVGHAVARYLAQRRLGGAADKRPHILVRDAIRRGHQAPLPTGEVAG